MTMDDKNFRLDQAVRPSRYRFTVKIDLEAGRFEGEGEIEIAMEGAREEIALHAIDLAIARASP